LDVLQTTHPGALHADLYCADGAFDVANIAYYKDARVATELSIVCDWGRRVLWSGLFMSALLLRLDFLLYIFVAYFLFPSLVTLVTSI
jgi:hypothetical protein